MSVSEYTSNYNLPQAQPDDKVNWYDMNDGFEKIDLAMKANQQEAENANAKADTNTNAIATANQSISKVQDDLSQLQGGTTTLEQTVSLHTTHLNEIDTINNSQSQQISVLEKAVQGDGEQIQTNSKDIVAVQENVTELSRQVSANQTEILSQGQMIENLQDDVSAIPKVETIELSGVEAYTGYGQTINIVVSEIITFNGRKYLHISATVTNVGESSPATLLSKLSFRFKSLEGYTTGGSIGQGLFKRQSTGNTNTYALPCSIMEIPSTPEKWACVMPRLSIPDTDIISTTPGYVECYTELFKTE